LNQPLQKLLARTHAPIPYSFFQLAMFTLFQYDLFNRDVTGVAGCRPTVLLRWAFAIYVRFPVLIVTYHCYDSLLPQSRVPLAWRFTYLRVTDTWMMCESRRYLYTRRLAPVRETAITSCTSAARSSFQYTKAADTTTCESLIQ
jgi:hypothetical protein